jgi:hypothetical protein
MTDHREAGRPPGPTPEGEGPPPGKGEVSPLFWLLLFGAAGMALIAAEYLVAETYLLF